MPQSCDAQLEPDRVTVVLDMLSDRLGVVLRPLGNNYEPMRLSARTCLLQLRYYRVRVALDLWDHNGLRPARNGRNKSEVPTITAHHFHEKRALMGRGGGPQSVERFERDV
jgi:hypothetical protein